MTGGRCRFEPRAKREMVTRHGLLADDGDHKPRPLAPGE